MDHQSEENFYKNVYSDFFEDLDMTTNKLESLDFNFDANANVGLSQDSVHKITEDLQNPLPPTDTQS